MRGLSEEFFENFKDGFLQGFTELVRADATLCLCIRDDYVNIYYRGGNVIKIAKANDKFNAFFDRKYLNEDSTKVPELPNVLNNKQDTKLWLDAIPLIKHEMDLWFGRHPKNEREFQQLMLRDNNYGNTAVATDYFVCDIEYANNIGRFDIIAVNWPSTLVARTNNKDLQLVFAEIKYLDNSLKGNAGLHKHINDINEFLANAHSLDQIKEEMKSVFNQKHELGLINNKNKIESFNDKKPQFILVFINHDPASIILRDTLKYLPDCPNADIKIATSNFFGYGLFAEAVYDLDDFKAKFQKNI